jgi:single-stranded-DNA-specific exonuclease
MITVKFLPVKQAGYLGAKQCILGKIDWYHKTVAAIQSYTDQRIEREWRIAARITPEADQSLSGYQPLLRQLLFNRGIATLEESKTFLAAMAPAVSDPFLIKNMGVVADRLEHAIRDQEHIVVYGDYDADGVTASALMVECINALGGQATNYIPDRFEEGYGLNVSALRTLKELGAAVVLTVDCGIRSLGEADEARHLDIDLIISDHHTPGPDLPDAFSIINTKQPGDNYPEKQLSGVGTAYKIAAALEQRFKTAEGWASASTFDLVALGTVADLVPLTGENRWLVRQGLALLRSPKRQGVMSLIGASGLKPALVSSADIGFMLGPRLNAAGRIDTARDAYQLLVTRDLFEAGRLAQDLDNRNRERQELTKQMTQAAEEIVMSAPRDLLLSAFHEEFNPGVVGLVASRLTERFYRPSIVGQRGPEFTRASCRSIPEFHITRALERCADLFVNFGGHAAAAGFTVKNENLREALERLTHIALDELGALDLKPILLADAEIPLSDLKPDIYNQLELLEPTGYGNAQVYFVSRGLELRNLRVVGNDGQHLKLTVSDGRIVFDAIAFRQGHMAVDLPRTIDMLYRFEINEFNGQRRFQLNVRDLKPSR